MKRVRLRLAMFTAMAATALAAVAPSAQAASPEILPRLITVDSVEPGGFVPQMVGILNNGDAGLNGPLTVKMTVSPGLTAPSSTGFVTSRDSSETSGLQPIPSECQSTELTLTCVIDAGTIAPGVQISSASEEVTLPVSPLAEGELSIEFEVSGGGAQPATISRTIAVGPQLPYEIGSWTSELRDAERHAMRQGAGTPLSFTNDVRPLSGPALIAGFLPTAAPSEQLKDAVVHLPPGMIGNPQVIPHCSFAQLAGHACPADSQVGVFRGDFSNSPFSPPLLPVYNIEPPSGGAARFAFNYVGTIVQLVAKVRPGDYGIDIVSKNTSTTLVITDAAFEFWGTPADPIHNGMRGSCLATSKERGGNGQTCSSSLPRTSFLRSPTSCTGKPLQVGIETNTYPHPEITHTSTAQMPSTQGCDRIPFEPGLSATPTSDKAETAAGLNVRVDLPNPGLSNPDGLSESDVKKVKVSLPEGVTINPSQGEGLGVCTPAQYASEELSFRSDPSKGCPGDSKIGTIEVHTPLLEETLEGSVFIAKPFDNPSGSLLALYFVIKNPERGVIIKLPAKVEPNERTGQLVTTVDYLPQAPFSDFTLKFREGARSPLSTPRSCGTYTTTAEFTPWSDPGRTVTSKSSFEITHGVGGHPCPSGLAPFHPQLQAGSLNNNALSFSPFNLRMIREDGEQEITNFSADLPPGLAAKLAGVPKCSEANLRATEAAPGNATINGSICPANSQVGRVTAGYGVGSVQTHATGKVFLAGPYRGTPLSIATVVPAVVGPFDLGTIVVRSAFRVDPETAEVHVDSRASDPIPHILKGIELHLRDLRVYMDRPEFTFNPTSCDKTEVGAFLSGSGLDFTSKADDPVVDVSNPYQAANCSLLPFKPKLAFKLKGGTHRGDFPALRATLKARPGDANLARAVVTLPHSAFLEQGHIKTVCTRVQFSADSCPPGSIYGHVVATTPLLDHSLEGDVYLRSNGGERLLPDLVMALRGEISVNAIGYVDSVKSGGIRTTFQTIPDTPVTKLVLRMQGGKKGLFVNSRNLCLKPSRADVRFTGQNGKAAKLAPVMRTSCKKAGRSKHERR